MGTLYKTTKARRKDKARVVDRTGNRTWLRSMLGLTRTNVGKHLGKVTIPTGVAGVEPEKSSFVTSTKSLLLPPG